MTMPSVSVEEITGPLIGRGVLSLVAPLISKNTVGPSCGHGTSLPRRGGGGEGLRSARRACDEDRYRILNAGGVHSTVRRGWRRPVGARE